MIFGPLMCHHVPLFLVAIIMSKPQFVHTLINKCRTDYSHSYQPQLYYFAFSANLQIVTSNANGKHYTCMLTHQHLAQSTSSQSSYLGCINIFATWERVELQFSCLPAPNDTKNSLMRHFCVDVLSHFPLWLVQHLKSDSTDVRCYRKLQNEMLSQRSCCSGLTPNAVLSSARENQAFTIWLAD